ncbi:MAG: hypothetical protein ACRDHZ_07195 [Ktedonobacteraceae bacterium]
MEVEKDRYSDSAYANQPAREAPQSAEVVDRRARIAVACNILIAMPAHPITYNCDMLFFVLCVQFVANVPSAALAQEIIDIM